MPGSTSETLSLNNIFSLALERRATDIHLMPGNYPVLRINNKLFVMMEEAILTADTIQNFTNSFLTEDDRELLKKTREVKTVYVWADRARFRTSVYYQKGFQTVAMRMIPQVPPGPKELGLPNLVFDKITQRQGLIIICGPFNSGKSTTMVSLLNHINSNNSKRIVTLERPIENLLVNNKSLVIQREVGKDTETFSQGLRDLIDEDVDVVGLSEASEENIHELVLTVVESGKMVIMIMNTNSVISTIEKLLSSMTPDRHRWAKDVLASSLKLIISQRLIPGISGDLVLAAEILTMSPAVNSIIKDENFAQLASVLQTSRAEGMTSLDYRLLELVRSGAVSVDEARKFAYDASTIH